MCSVISSFEQAFIPDEQLTPDENQNMVSIYGLDAVLRHTVTWCLHVFDNLLPSQPKMVAQDDQETTFVDVSLLPTQGVIFIVIVHKLLLVTICGQSQWKHYNYRQK